MFVAPGVERNAGEMWRDGADTAARAVVSSGDVPAHLSLHRQTERGSGRPVCAGESSLSLGAVRAFVPSVFVFCVN